MVSCSSCLKIREELPLPLAQLYGYFPHSKDDSFLCSVCGDILHDSQTLVMFTHLKPHPGPVKAILSLDDFEAYLEKAIKQLSTLDYKWVQLNTSYLSLQLFYLCCFLFRFSFELPKPTGGEIFCKEGRLPIDFAWKLSISPYLPTIHGLLLPKFEDYDNLEIWLYFIKYSYHKSICLIQVLQFLSC
jgi:hypothetical protein